MPRIFKNTPFNRTTVECKFSFSSTCPFSRTAFNRTTVECKFVSMEENYKNSLFNRSILASKFIY